jgi:hypothetical protein
VSPQFALEIPSSRHRAERPYRCNGVVRFSQEDA